MYFDRHDIVEAHYCYCMDYHGGQGCPLYAKLCRIGRYYRPRPNLSYDTLGDNAREIYDNLASAS
jgi:hypothetical protein